MKSGLLWFDSGKKPIWDKIEDAARRYKEKFGVAPDTAFVNPVDLDPDAKPKTTIKIQVAGKATIMPNHIWLGVRE
jgi:hypothetical protein